LEEAKEKLEQEGEEEVQMQEQESAAVEGQSDIPTRGKPRDSEPPDKPETAEDRRKRKGKGHEPGWETDDHPL
jgi:hypothetical protein